MNHDSNQEDPLRREIVQLQHKILELEWQLRSARAASSDIPTIAMKNSGIAWWDQNLVTNKVSRSDTWASMLGYRPIEIEGQTEAWKELLHPEDLPWVEKEARKHEAGETELFEVEHRMKTKSGGWKWILNRGRVVERDPENGPIRAVGTHLDITARKETELSQQSMLSNLEQELSMGKTLRGVLPICTKCKKIRDKQGSWNHIENFLKDRSGAEFSHGFCPECMNRLYPGILDPRDR